MVLCSPCGGGLLPAQRLLNEAYPPPKALLAAAPEYKPLNQDLSRLVYHCQNKPSELRRVGEELEKKVTKESRDATGGYQKSRAALLISLAILRALMTECKRDLGLFARSALRCTNVALNVRVYQKGDLDLEVVGRAASCFTAFATFTDGGAIGVDDSLTSEYLAILQKFSSMAISGGPGEKPDMEEQNRARLIALAALHAASGSDSLFTSNAEFPKQIKAIIPALLENIFEGGMNQLKLETAKIEIDASPSPFFSEFSARRPINDRRAPSLHAHIPGEKGPSTSDVLSAAMRSLDGLVGQCKVNQVSAVLDATVAFLDKTGWTDVERSCWLAERLTAFTSLQYRFVVPTRFVELLVDMTDPVVTPKHSTVLAMITTILNSHVSLVGLGVTDLLNSLVTLIIRRIHFDPLDALLPALVQSVSSLGTHIYYADQINDIVEEIALRMAELPTGDTSRSEILRVLIHCITGVMSTAHIADEADVRATTPMSLSNDKGKGPQLDTPLEFLQRRQTGRRNPIVPQVWQETLPLLCESKYAVRAAYARALLLYLRKEMPREQPPLRPGDLTGFRFSNALHAAIYTLAMSSCLGAASPDPTPAVSAPASPVIQNADKHQSNDKEELMSETKDEEQDKDKDKNKSQSRAEKGVSFNVTEPTPTGTPPNGTSTPPRKGSRSRRVSLPLNRLHSSANLSSFDNVATPLDFAALVAIIDELHAAIPVAALVTGLPMLLALDKDAGMELVRRPGDGRSGAWVLERKRAIRESVAIVWRRVAERWGVKSVEELADKALNTLPEPFLVPPLPPTPAATVLPVPDEAEAFFQHTVEGESSSTTQPLLDPETIVSEFAGSTNVQTATSRDTPTLTKRFATKWTVETAVKDSVERFSSAQIKPTGDDAHFDVAHALMNIENPSYQSFSRPQSRAVDVTDLREALGGRAETMSLTYTPSVTSTSASRTLPDEERKRKGLKANQDVKDVLKDIFKDKKKTGARRNGQPVGVTPAPTST